MIEDWYNNCAKMNTMDLDRDKARAEYYTNTIGDIFYISVNSRSSKDPELLTINETLVACFSFNYQGGILTDARSVA